METFFKPRSIAVVGASRKPNLGNYVVQNLKAGYDGKIYPINPNYDTIEDLPCFPSVEAVPGEVDLVIILVPADYVAGILASCAVKGTRSVIIETAGFNETGDAGRKLQEECDQIAGDANIRLWGPNCMGLVDVPKQYYFSFINPRILEEGLLPGHISLIVQSGMMSAIFLLELARRGIGVAKACSIGNRADVDECDLMAYLDQDEETKVIALYLESIPDGRKFARMVETISKPVVLLKGGQSRAGAKAAMSHTSSLSGDSRLMKSVLSNKGVIMADSVFEMSDIANTLVNIPEMNPECRIVVITLSGGAGILACDALDRSGLPIAGFTEETRKKLEKIFPPWMPPENPVDLFPSVAMRGREVAFMGSLTAILEDDSVDVIVVHVVTGLQDSTMDFIALKKLADERGKIIVFWLMGTKEGKRDFAENARTAGFSVFSDVSEMARCLGAAAGHQQYLAAAKALSSTTPGDEKTIPAETVPEAAGKYPTDITDKGVVDEFDSKELLARWQIPTVDEMIADSIGAAWEFAENAGGPVVLKGLAEEMAHKTEHGLVRLNISDRSTLDTAWQALTQTMNGQGRILVQKQLKVDYELIAGFLRDPQFGACVMFGIGGILAELEPDVSFEMAPLSHGAAIGMIRSLRNHKLMTGFRNLPELDEDQAAQVLVCLGKMGTACPWIEQVDINPLVVSGGRLTAVDANIIVGG